MFPIQNNNKQKQRKKEFPLFRRYSPRLPLILRGERERGLSTSEGGFLPQAYEGFLFRLEVGFEPRTSGIRGGAGDRGATCDVVLNIGDTSGY